MTTFVSILILLTTTLSFTGCESVSPDQAQVQQQAYYCAECSEEGDSSNKFCPSCGVEAEWLTEKPVHTEDKITEEKPNDKVENTKPTTPEGPKDSFNQADANEAIHEQYGYGYCSSCSTALTSDDASYRMGFCGPCLQCQSCGMIPSRYDEVANGYCHPCINAMTETEVSSDVICSSCGYNYGSYQGFMYDCPDGNCMQCGSFVQ